MSTRETGSMAALINSLSTSFNQVPQAAVPAVLDCILASSGLPPSSLFDPLLDTFPKLSEVLVLGREKEGIPVDIIHVLDACLEIPQLGVVRSLNVHVSGAIALWEYARQQRSQ